MEREGMRTVAVIQCSDEFGYWFAGLVDGEGSFNILQNKNSLHCALSICLRNDDRAILERIQRTLGVGRLHDEKPRPTETRWNTKPACRWVVSKGSECMAIVDLFERYPLQTKKAADFKLWSIAVREFYENRMYGNRWTTDPAKQIRDAKILDLKKRLEEQRRYAA